jgi:hypothetical protein
VSSVSSAADLNFPSFSRTECGLSSSFFQVTVAANRPLIPISLGHPDLR